MKKFARYGAVMAQSATAMPQQEFTRKCYENLIYSRTSCFAVTCYFMYRDIMLQKPPKGYYAHNLCKKF